MKQIHTHHRNLRPVLSGTYLSLKTNKRNESVVLQMFIVIDSVTKLYRWINLMLRMLTNSGIRTVLYGIFCHDSNHSGPTELINWCYSFIFR